MIYAKRATLKLRREWKKSTILFLLIILLSSMVTSTMIINFAVERTREQVESNMIPSAVIGIDYTEVSKYGCPTRRPGANFNEIPVVPVVSPELIRQIAALPYVSHYEYFTSFDFYSPSLTDYRPVLDNGLSMSDDWWWGDLGFPIKVRGVQRPYFYEIEQGMIELVSGRTFSDEELTNLSNVVMISEGFAIANELRIGSKFPLVNVIFDPTKVFFAPDRNKENTLAMESYDVEVIGVFRTNVTSVYEGYFVHLELKYEFGNRIYAPNTFVEMASERTEFMLAGLDPTGWGDWQDYFEEWTEEVEIADDGTIISPAVMMFNLSNMVARENNTMRTEAVFMLDSPRSISDFVETANDLLPPFHMIVIGDNHFHEILSALTVIESTFSMLLLVSILIQVLILGLLITYFMRNRKREIGIYLSVGVAKGKITLQLIIEILLVAVFALVISLIVGNLLASRLADRLILNDLLTYVEQSNVYIPGGILMDRFGLSSGQALSNVINRYDVSLNVLNTIIIMGVGLGATLLATFIPIMRILRLKPREIMM